MQQPPPRAARGLRQQVTGIAALGLAFLAFAPGSNDASATDTLNAALGKALFERQWVAAPASTDTADGLGPLYNARSCSTCHRGGGGTRFPLTGNARDANGIVVRLTDDAGNPHPVLGRQLQNHAISGFAAEGSVHWQNHRVSFTLADPTLKAASEIRSAPSLRVMQAIEQVDEAEILKAADPDDSNGDGISGRVRMAENADGSRSAGRFGWKATHATLTLQIADALAFDLGLSTAAGPFPAGDCTPLQQACLRAKTGESSATDGHEVSATMVVLIADFLRSLRPARKAEAAPAIFAATGCADCHRPTLSGRRGETVTLYSDLLLHDIGPADTGVVKEADAAVSEWRTAPLVDLFANDGGRRYLHDGRAATLAEAIARHGGEAEKSSRAFENLNRDDQNELLHFLSTL